MTLSLQGPLRWVPAGTVLLGLAVAGCGSGSHSSTPAGSRSNLPAATAAPTSTPATTTPSLASSNSTTPPTGPASSATGGAAADLAAVENDEQVLGAASDQSDADFNAGVAAQSQNDQP